jgi:hypothetical protein
VPDFFIVGSPKTGTTALHAMLRRHPQIFMPTLKEPQFLADDLRPHARARGDKGAEYPKTMADYLALFEDARPEQRVGEASATYLASRTAASIISELQPDARIIVILREPASFLRSLHLQYVQTHIETERDLRTALSLETQRREGKRIPRKLHRPQFLQYSDQVRYVEHLARYYACFSPDRVLVLIYDDFVNDNAATVRRVLRLLDVDEDAPVAVTRRNVTNRTVRSSFAGYLMQVKRSQRGVIARSTKATVATLTTPRVRRRVADVFRPLFVRNEVPPVDEVLMRELRERFKPEVVALSEYLDRDLVRLWGYDELGATSSRASLHPLV